MKILLFSLLGALLVAVPFLVFSQPGRPMGPPSDPSYEMREISCVSGGNRIYGEAFVPKASGRHPAVILSHGYGGTHEGFYPLADTLAKAGYVCYCYDFAGGSPWSRSEGRTEDMSIFTERQNLMDVLETVRSWDCVDTANVFLLGESQGGCVSAITAPRVKDRIRAILLIYPALCIPDDGFALYPTLADVPDTVTFMGMRIGRAYYERFYDGYDIYKDIAGYQGDVLIVHGTEDGLVKPEYSAKASNGYGRCELHLIFKAGHGFWKPEHRALYHEYVLDFLERHQDRPVKTTFQTGQGWRPSLDTRADAVMVYGMGQPGSLPERLSSWRERGYQTHFMTGIAWGGYQEYFTGAWDGVPHLDEGQVTATGDTLWHSRTVPYIVPTENYLRYFRERVIKPVIDAGVDDIFLEEPEFWARAGWSDSFKREWEAFYGEPWQRPDASHAAAWRAAKLKYHLYYRALEESFTYAKEYGRSLGRDIRCYVPTHSLVNYSQWGIVSPEASLASLPCVDGYIAQVWTGTSRTRNYYRGVLRERVFEAAYLEYACMSSMTAPTGRRLWFLTDPVEDGVRDWEDFRRNYQATFTAQLLIPQVADYEIMPWPERIYERPYPVKTGSKKTSLIPADYATQMQVMTNALQQMPAGSTVPSPVSVLMGNSLMFQVQPPVKGPEDQTLSDFFGLALPLLKRGVPVGVTHIENLDREAALDGVKLLVMTYANMKPLEADAHRHLADWVRRGGKLVYSATDTDPFQQVPEWWNTGDCDFATPSGHLFSLLGIPADAPEGSYSCGKGKVTVLRHDPKEYVQKAGGEAPYLAAVEALYGPLKANGLMQLDRGPYRVVAVLDEGASAQPYRLEGCYIDLYDPDLPVYAQRELSPGTQGLFYDVRKAPQPPCILAAASRASEVRSSRNGFSYLCKGPEGTVNVTRILLDKRPSRVLVDGKSSTFEWDPFSNTCLLRFPNHPDGVRVEMTE